MQSQNVSSGSDNPDYGKRTGYLDPDTNFLLAY